MHGGNGMRSSLYYARTVGRMLMKNLNPGYGNKLTPEYKQYKKYLSRRRAAIEWRKRDELEQQEAAKEKVRLQTQTRIYVRRGLDTELARAVARNGYEDNCPICKRMQEMILDHNHTTGKARGFICTRCNTLLGMAKDSIRILQAAIQYLEERDG